MKDSLCCEKLKIEKERAKVLNKKVTVQLGLRSFERFAWLKPSPLVEYSLPSMSKSLFVKHDGQCAGLNTLYGATKLRKLAFILCQSTEQNTQKLFTVGAQGSHHVLASCIAAQHLGLPIHVALTGQEYSDHSRQVYDLIKITATSVSLLKAKTSLEFKSEFKQWQDEHIDRDQKNAIHHDWIPTGGSCVLGALGMIEAVQELLVQVKKIKETRPLFFIQEIYMACASGSSLVGLLLGLALYWPKDWPCPKVLAVRVTDRALVNRKSIMRLYRQVAQELAVESKLDETLPYFELLGDYIGLGYAQPSTQSEKARQWALTQGLVLDPSYTAKAMSALLARTQQTAKKEAQSNDLLAKKHGVILFWHSLDERSDAELKSYPSKITLTQAHTVKAE